jgi:hypothetical protein
MTLVNSNKVIFFLRHRAQYYVLGYEGEEYDFDGLETDLMSYLEHPENWRHYMHDWPNEASEPDSTLSSVEELKVEIDRAKHMLAIAEAEPPERHGHESRIAWAKRSIPIYEKLLKGD